MLISAPYILVCLAIGRSEKAMPYIPWFILESLFEVGVLFLTVKSL
jgi:hypothetical protein